MTPRQQEMLTVLLDVLDTATVRVQKRPWRTLVNRGYTEKEVEALRELIRFELG
jgi:hypothetical protein